jgi:hypothetical protein
MPASLPGRAASRGVIDRWPRQSGEIDGCSCWAPMRSIRRRSAPANRRLHRQPRRQGRASRRRHPAGCRLYREVGTYVNTEGRVQMTQPRHVPAGRCARGLGDPARAVGSAVGKTLPYDSLAQLRKAMYQGRAAPRAASTRSRQGDAACSWRAGLRRSGRCMSSGPSRRRSPAFYLTNPIARASRIMA